MAKKIGQIIAGILLLNLLFIVGVFVIKGYTKLAILLWNL